MQQRLLILYLLGLILCLNACLEDSNTTELSLSKAYDISLLEATGNSFSVANRASSPRGIQLLGDTLLLIHARGNQEVLSYILKQKGQLSSAVFFSSFSTRGYLGSTNQGANGHGVYLRPQDLRKMWLFNRTEVWEFDLTTPGDVSSATFSNYLDLAQYVDRGHGLYFHPDGRQMYIDDRDKARVHQFSLANAWSTATATPRFSLDISAHHEAVRALSFHPSGMSMFLLDTDLQEIQAYTLSEAWELSSAQFVNNKSLTLSDPRGFTWNADGTKAYVMNTATGTIFEYAIAEE